MEGDIYVEYKHFVILFYIVTLNYLAGRRLVHDVLMRTLTVRYAISI